MELAEFKKDLLDRNGISIDDTYILFNDFELYNQETNNSVLFDSFDKVLDYKIENKSIKEIIEEKENTTEIDEGGRGASSGGPGGSLFGNQRNPGGKRVISAGGGGNSMPAYMNTLVPSGERSVDSIAKAFGKRTLNETREYSASLDNDGFAHAYHKGGKSSTAHLVYENGYSIHNHPTKDKNGKTVAWNIYSKADLKNTALDKAKGTIVVSNGNRTMYKFTKTQKFDSKSFIKGLNSAKAKTSNYDKEVDSWLRKNQKEYGYKYTKSKF